MTKLLSFFLLAIIFTSCSKEVLPVRNEGLTGNWQLTAVFGGNAKGVNFAWNALPDNYSEVIAFRPDGIYVKTIQEKDARRQQTGRYEVTESNILVLSPHDGTAVETLMIYENTGSSLVLQQPGKDGFIRYGYAPQRQ